MIVVIGQARSGTSLAAGVLHYLGVNMGTHFPIIDEWNDKGSFFDIDLHQMLLEFQHHGIDLPRFEATIKDRKEPWGIKDHAILPFLSQLDLPVTKVILTERPIAESVESLAERRGDGDKESARRYLDGNTADIIAFLADYRGDVLRVPFDCGSGPSADPQAYVQRIADFVGLPVNPEAVAFVSPELRRFGVTEDPPKKKCGCSKPKGKAH